MIYRDESGRPLKVLIINTYDRGGAANSCKRLHLGLRRYGVDSKVLLRTKWGNWPCSFNFQPSVNSLSLILRVKNKLKQILGRAGNEFAERKKTKQRNYFNSRDGRLEMFSFPDSGYDITQSTLYKEADIINLHWVAEFLDFKLFFKKNTKPVIWTLHDMNPFSGGEHFTESLVGIDEDGYPVLRRLTKKESQVQKKIFLKKKKIFSKVKDLTIVSPSKWLAEEAKKSKVFQGKEILHIPYGLDPEIFHPKDRKQSREFLKIPGERKVILFVADSLSKNRKGFLFLKKALELLEGVNFLLCAVGSNNGDLELENDILELGIIKDSEIMCAAYSAADVFVIPSLMDNLPNTVLESIMCGTPVIGFPVGGIPEMITHGKNGLITREISAPSLHRTLVEFFNSTESFNREEIREEAIKNFDSKIQAKKYISLFRNIMENSN